MNTSLSTPQKSGEGIEAHLHDVDAGSTDIESQQTPVSPSAQTFMSNSSSSSAGSNDRLVAGEATPILFEDLPPTYTETALVILFSFLLIGASVMSVMLVSPRQRPMPVQFLEKSGEYVRNLVNNEIYYGETIDTMGLMLLCVFCPGAIQL